MTTTIAAQLSASTRDVTSCVRGLRARRLARRHARHEDAGRHVPGDNRAGARACVVAKLDRVDFDGLVGTESQWPEDCRQCGVPAVIAVVNHWEAMSDPASVAKIAELAREPLARWSPEQVTQAKRVLYGEPEPEPGPRRPGLLRKQ